MLRLILLFIIFPFTVSSQQYSKQHIKAKADSVLLSITNEHIFEHAVFDARGSYYTYNSDTGVVWELLDNKDIISTHVEKIFVRYVVNYPYPKCEAYNFISGITTIQFDGAFRLLNKPDISYIPDFVLKNKRCNFKTEDEAVEIAKKHGFNFEATHMHENKLNATSPEPAWDFMSTAFTGDSIKMQRIVIDARSGKVLDTIRKTSVLTKKISDTTHH